jgi:hypothetical protein
MVQVDIGQYRRDDASDAKGNLSPRRDFDPPVGVAVGRCRLDAGCGLGSNGG